MQNSVNHRTFERIWLFQFPTGRMPLRVESPPLLGARRVMRCAAGVGRCVARVPPSALPLTGRGAGGGAWRRTGSRAGEENRAGSAASAGVLVGAFARLILVAGVGAARLHPTALPFGRARGECPPGAFTARAGESPRAAPHASAASAGVCASRAPLVRRGRPHPLLTLHRMEQDYPLNLSISLSGGEETNQDAPSNGE